MDLVERAGWTGRAASAAAVGGATVAYPGGIDVVYDTVAAAGDLRGHPAGAAPRAQHLVRARGAARPPAGNRTPWYFKELNLVGSERLRRQGGGGAGTPSPTTSTSPPPAASTSPGCSPTSFASTPGGTPSTPCRPGRVGRPSQGGVRPARLTPCPRSLPRSPPRRRRSSWARTPCWRGRGAEYVGAAGAPVAGGDSIVHGPEAALPGPARPRPPGHGPRLQQRPLRAARRLVSEDAHRRPLDRDRRRRPGRVAGDPPDPTATSDPERSGRRGRGRRRALRRPRHREGGRRRPIATTRWREAPAPSTPSCAARSDARANVVLVDWSGQNDRHPGWFLSTACT